MVNQRYLWRIFGDFEHPSELLALEGIQLPTKGGLCWLFTRFVLALSLGKSLVVGEPRHTASFGKIGGLLMIGIKRNLMASVHRQPPSSCLRSISDSCVIGSRRAVQKIP